LSEGLVSGVLTRLLTRNIIRLPPNGTRKADEERQPAAEWADLYKGTSEIQRLVIARHLLGA